MFGNTLIAFLLWRLLFLSPFVVDGPSMTPTLQSQQLFILDSFAYRKEDPQRGDIVVFAFEKKPAYFYVKRVIGLPGERVHVATDGVYLEDSAGKKNRLLEPYLAHAQEIATSVSLKNGYKDETFVVPPGKYLVMGDNRAQSLDSRFFKDPFIPIGWIKGKYLFTLLSL